LNPLTGFRVNIQVMNTLKSVLVVVGVFIVSVAMAQGERTDYASVDLAKQVKLYPNPAIEFLTVKFETPQAKKVKLVLHSIIGNELETESEIVDEFEVRVRVKDLSTGFYLLSIKNNETGFKGAYKFLKK